MKICSAFRFIAMNLIFHMKGFIRAGTRFETEAQGSSKMTLCQSSLFYIYVANNQISIFFGLPYIDVSSC